MEDLDTMSIEIYQSIDSIISTLIPKSIEKLLMKSHYETFSSDVPSFEYAQKIAREAKSEANIDGANWLSEVQRLHSDNVKEQQTVSEIQFFIVDNGCYCGTADEIMCELAIDVKNLCGNDHLYLGGYTNGCEGYLPTAEEFDRGGYEVLWTYLLYYIYHGRVMPLKRETANRLVCAVIEQWNLLR